MSFSYAAAMWKQNDIKLINELINCLGEKQYLFSLLLCPPQDKSFFFFFLIKFQTFLLQGMKWCDQRLFYTKRDSLWWQWGSVRKCLAENKIGRIDYLTSKIKITSLEWNAKNNATIYYFRFQFFWKIQFLIHWA